ncbi:hypothetical protein SEA_GUDMIT_22 [Gordonia phage Gudmit]|nr:hypothetical protein SEA_GUDMIT_22 [Gordonia phage Gudmit]
MRWPWKRPQGEVGSAKEARAHLERLREQRPEVARLAEIGRIQQERNHFGEGIEVAMRRKYARNAS